MKLNFTICLVLLLITWWQQKDTAFGNKTEYSSMMLLSFGKQRAVNNTLS